ncbi:unnamed protein product [Phytophthora fragariaefolia]|uniref:Unnamed protein product n=1 Tax=Phytophthora fragariaefolia TaxID=1490495 RepID=A0A9W6XPZ2_9STRA|nr:unnamed protein product [Phytophthora fragariaefolia]
MSSCAVRPLQPDTIVEDGEVSPAGVQPEPSVCTAGNSESLVESTPVSYVVPGLESSSILLNSYGIHSFQDPAVPPTSASSGAASLGPAEATRLHGVRRLTAFDF